MPRLPARVGWITHKKTGTKVALRLNKDTMTFQAEWAGRTHRNQDGATLRREIVDLIEASEHLVFHPVIEIEMKQFHTRRLDASVFVILDRYYYTNNDGSLLKAKWEDQEGRHARYWNPGKGFTGLPYYKPATSYGNTDYHYLAYSENLWAGLTALLETIKQARSRITQLLGADDAVLRLEAVGAEFIKALPAPKENEDE